MLLNLVYVQLVLKQWQNAFEAYNKVMLLYVAQLLEGGTPLGRAEQDETLHRRGGG